VSRSLKKGPYVDAKLLRKVMDQKASGGRDPIRTWARSCTVVPEFIGHQFNVHNGKSFLKVTVTEEMVGHKLGEFSPTRIFRRHSGASSRAAASAKAAAAAKGGGART